MFFLSLSFGLPGIPSYSWAGSLKGAHPLGNFAVLRRANRGGGVRFSIFFPLGCHYYHKDILSNNSNTFFSDWKVIHLQLIILKLIDRIMRNTKIQLHV